MIEVISVIICFLCGAIPTGYLLTKKYLGIDIRNEGSGNIGSTNVRRIAGKKLSIITQVIDVLKGLLPVLLGLCLSKYLKIGIARDTYLSIIAISVILGHDFTPFLRFKGGKGVNTTLGAFFLIAPLPVLGAVAVHFLLRLFTKIVSIRSIAIGIALPVFCILMNYNIRAIIAGILAGALLIYAHKDNVIRLMQGKEK